MGCRGVWGMLLRACRCQLAVAILCVWQPAVVQALRDCPADAKEVLVGGAAVHFNIPALKHGDFLSTPCAQVRPGFVGSVTTMCVATVVSVNTRMCVAAGCPAGQSAPARIGDGAQLHLAEVTVRQGLSHDDAQWLHCRNLKDGYEGYAQLRCSFGELSADASSCHPPFKGPSSVFRVLNNQYLAGDWRIFELAFYETEDCSGGELRGEIFASSEDAKFEQRAALAVDGNWSTFWSAHCSEGCELKVAWMGLVLPEPKTVRCIRLQQSQVPCCRAESVRAEVWDGEGWQHLQSWNLTGPPSILGKDLAVPITCTENKPSGPGVVHDCDGPPVVGVQGGQTCAAKCGEGFAGDEQSFFCTASGAFDGMSPGCIDAAEITRLGSFSLIGFALALLAFAYRSVYMGGKARLTFDLEMMPTPLTGHWLEHHGKTAWERLDEDKRKRDALRMLGGDLTLDKNATEEEQAAQQQQMTGEDMARLEEEFRGLTGRKKRKALENAQSVDGLCSPCADPDVCLAYATCPLCRVADTWHTIGLPEWQSYWKIFWSYVACPFCWPCLNFYGRYRVRKAFKIPLEPHRDFLVHCVCCCLCTPCAHVQEARLVDAPILYFKCQSKLIEMQQAHIKLGEGLM
mmetsp:Transcript_37849/g.68408  ORF Transcript_37849/g.68408 Transcript_37849/m.68408 type:complete len:628 (-) Transcript_37849:73-1956(-)